MKTYINLLHSNSILKRLSLIQLIAYFGAWFSNVAIYTLLLQMKVSADIVAFVAMLHFIAGVVQAPFSGSIIDKINPKILMLTLLVIEILSTLSLIVIQNISDLWLLYILIFVRMAAASFYFTTEMSLLPKILKGNDLQKANEIHSIIWSFSYTLGMAISGFVVYYFGVKMAFILDSIMFCIAFVLLYNLDVKLKLVNHSENIFSMMQGVFSYLREHPVALHLMFLHAFIGLTAFDALVALMVDKYYAGIIATSLALGFMHASRAIGLVIGPMLFGRWINNKRLIYMFVGQAFAVLLWSFFMKNFYLSLVASVIVGLFTTTLWSYTYTLLQKNIDEKFYGRVVAYNDMLFLLSAAFTSFMIGFLATHSLSLEYITALIALAFLVGAFYFWWIIKFKKISEIS